LSIKEEIISIKQQQIPPLPAIEKNNIDKKIAFFTNDHLRDSS